MQPVKETNRYDSRNTKTFHFTKLDKNQDAGAWSERIWLDEDFLPSKNDDGTWNRNCLMTVR